MKQIHYITNRFLDPLSEPLALLKLVTSLPMGYWDACRLQVFTFIFLGILHLLRGSSLSTVIHNLASNITKK